MVFIDSNILLHSVDHVKARYKTGTGAYSPTINEAEFKTTRQKKSQKTSVEFEIDGVIVNTIIHDFHVGLFNNCGQDPKLVDEIGNRFDALLKTDPNSGRRSAGRTSGLRTLGFYLARAFRTNRTRRDAQVLSRASAASWGGIVYAHGFA